MKSIDILCIGEVLVDFIGHEMNTSINKTKNYHRFLGGSPTNVAVNASRLGLKSLLVASCGKDGLGDYILRKLNSNNVNTTCVAQLDKIPTSVILVSKSTNTPDFIAYRQADCEIQTAQLSDSILKSTKILHTTCFALSKNPARETILERANAAKKMGLQLSIDFNFSEKIWPDRAEAASVLKLFLKNNPLVKISDDDCFRFFNETKSDADIFKYFHQLGANMVCLTKGKSGVIVSQVGKDLICQNGLEVHEIKDATGAGDAFWTGFLFGILNNKSIENCVTIAQKLAAIKLQNIGQLPQNLNRDALIQ